MKFSFLKNNIFYKENNREFLTPKRIILLIISGLIFVGFAVASFILLDVDIIKIFNFIGLKITSQPVLVIFLLLSIMCPFFKASFTIFYIRPAMKEHDIHVSWLEYIVLSFKVFFFNTITPFASGGEPYVIYWIKSRGGTIKLASSLSLVSMIVGSIGQILITIPSFVIISIDYAKIAAVSTDAITGTLVYWFIVVGLLLNVIILTIWVTMGASKKFHYGCSRFSNWILKKFKRPHLSKDEMYEKYIVQAEFQAIFYDEMKKIKRNIFIALYIVLTDLFLYIVVFFSFALVSPDFQINGDTFCSMFNITNVSLTANNFIPIPSGEGTIQLTIGILSQVYFKDLSGIFNSIGFWKIITNYLPLIFSIVIIGWYYLFKIILIQKFTMKNIDNNLKNKKEIKNKKQI